VIRCDGHVYTNQGKKHGIFAVYLVFYMQLLLSILNLSGSIQPILAFSKILNGSREDARSSVEKELGRVLIAVREHVVCFAGLKALLERRVAALC
jgi:hypothetical protein